MKRRQILRAGGIASVAGISGCISSGGFSGSRDTPGTTPPSDHPDGFWRWVNLVELNPPPQQHEVDFELRVTQPWITTEKTARIEGKFTNTSSERRLFDPILLHNMVPENPGIRILEDTENPKSPHEPSCTGENGKTDSASGEPGEQPPSEPLTPGESFTTIGYIKDDVEVEGCFPTDVYDFSIQQSFKKGEHSEGQSYQISFRLGVQGEN